MCLLGAHCHTSVFTVAMATAIIGNFRRQLKDHNRRNSVTFNTIETVYEVWWLRHSIDFVMESQSLSVNLRQLERTFPHALVET